VTGIGFIGAGVIFKEGITVNGLTTAALIWVTAALGMAIGYHHYSLAIVVSIMVVITLFVLEPVQRFINKFHRVKDYRIKTDSIGEVFKKEMEVFFQLNDITFRCMKVVKESNDAVYLYRISSPDRNYDAVNLFLLNHHEVKSFEV
jgi:putative Mg2+ transporter-C (MgtC) family protein